jgi:ABC-2 type transport system ATP-binding protein
MYHGGGSNKSNPYDSERAKALAKRGYVATLYSARGHGNSTGQTTIIGPKEVRDAFDVTGWALGKPGAPGPAHPDFHIDPKRIGLWGVSQGGLHVNLSQAHSDDPQLNPYGIRFRVLEPGNTADSLMRALIPNEVVKLSFGAGIAVQSYVLGTQGAISPLIGKWTTLTATDTPAAWGAGGICDRGEHDTLASSLKADFAERSPVCFLDRMTPPSLWAQSLDDGLFPAQMGIDMWRKMPNEGNRLYLTMGGHGAPTATEEVERDKFRRQVAFLDHYLRGKQLRGPRVVYWTRQPEIVVPGDRYAYPDGAWERRTANTWPPKGIRRVSYALSANGEAVRAGAKTGSMPLAPISIDEGTDPVVAAALSSTPLGSSPIPRKLPATNLPGFIAGFETPAFDSQRELSGAPQARLAWTPASPDTQLSLKVFDKAPDGTLTLLSRGIQGIHGAPAGVQGEVTVRGDAFSAEIPAAHSLLVWIAAADLGFYKPYVPSLGGTLAAGPDSTVSLPLSR